MYTEEELQRARQWCKDNGYLDALKNVEIQQSWYDRLQVFCLDDFNLYPIALQADGEEIDRIVEKNVNFKFDLECVMRTGSGYGLGCLLYELMIYVQQDKAPYCRKS